MKQLALLVKLQLKNTYRSKGKNGMVAFVVVLLFFYVFLEFSLISTLVGISPALSEKGLLPELLTGVCAMGLSGVSILGLFPMLNQLYFSKDSEFFLGLPVSSSKIYLSKLLTVYLSQFMYSAALLLPALFAIGITLKLNFLFYITVIAAMFVMPAIPLAALSVICLPLMYIVSFFKNRGAMSSVLAIILYIAIFAVYMLLIGKSGEGEDMGIDKFIGPLNIVSVIFFPVLALFRFALLLPLNDCSLALSMLLNLAVFVLTIVALVGLTLLISNLMYDRAVVKQLENVKRGKKVAFKKQKKAIVALMSKEWKDIIRTPIFAMQCFTGLIIGPIMLIIVGMGGDVSEDSVIIMWFTIAFLLQTIVVSVNIGASTTFSREGGAFYIVKLLPIKTKTLIRAKLCLYNIIYITVLTLCILIQMIIFRAVAWWLGIMIWAYLVTMNYGFICLCMTLDISKPKLDWQSYREVVKNGRNAMLPTLLGIGFSIVIAAGAITTYILLTRVISEYAACAVAGSVMTVIAIVFAVIARLYLRSNAERFFERIDA